MSTSDKLFRYFRAIRGGTVESQRVAPTANRCATHPMTGARMGVLANVLEYGADPSGATDSSPAIQNAWNSSPLLYIPSGKYLLNAPLVGPNANGAGIIGDGAAYGQAAGGSGYSGAGTLLMANFKTGNVITSHQNILHPHFRGFAVCRTAQALSGYGLEMNPTSTQDQCLLDDLHFQNHDIGAHLGSTGWSVASHIMCEDNRSHGFEIVGQWQVLNLFAANNGGSGFFIASLSPASNGQWRGLSTYNNAGFGLHVEGVSTARRIEGLRISDSFFGGDLSGEVNVDSYGTVPHSFNNVYCEANTDKNGFVFSPNNSTVLLSNCISTTAGLGSALISSSRVTMINGGSFEAIGPSSALGISVLGKRASIMGARVTGFSTNISAQSITAVSIMGCYAEGSINTVGTGTVTDTGNY